MPAASPPTTDIPEIYRTTTLMEGMANFPPASVFLRNKLFSTTVTSPTDQVALDFYNGTTRLAPFVARLKKGIAIPRERAKTSFFSPPFIKPVRPLSADELFYRGMGVNAYSTVNADQREANLLAEDWQDLDLRISRTENWMVSQCLFTGSILCLDGDDNKPVARIDYGEFSQTIIAKPWTDPTADPLNDLRQCMRAVSAACGFQADLIVLGKNAADAFEGNQNVQNAYNKLFIQQGTIQPKLLEEIGSYGVTILGTYRQIALYCDESTYLDEKGVLQNFVPPGKVLVASTGLQNKMCYAAVAQVRDDENGMGVFEGARVPQVYYPADEDCRYLRLSARPVPCPSNIQSWTVLDAVPAT
jgi:Phage major capsid protein E